MPVRIEIECHSAEEARQEMQRLLGEATGGAAPRADEESARQTDTVTVDAGKYDRFEPDEPREPEAPSETDTVTKAPKGRKYGSPGKGKGRRTKEEMAEDAEIDRLAGLAGVDPSAREEDATALRLALIREADQTKASESRGITNSPEDRKDPEQEEPAEGPAEEPGAVTGEIVEDEEPKTRVDLQRAMMRLVEARQNEHGEAEGGQKARDELGELLGYPQLSKVPDDPKVFAEIIAKIEAAI